MGGAGGHRGRVGRGGESLAALFLRMKGYRIEARNWRCPLGEIDIVAWDRDTLVFIEVKARTGRSAGTPEEAVTPEKRRRLVRLAEAYLARVGGEAPPCRFDIVAVAGAAWRPSIRHLRAAFRADALG